MKKHLFFLFMIIVFILFSASVITAQDRPDALQKYRNGEYNEAVRICLAEIEQMPRNLDSYTVLGWSLVKLQRYQEAIDYGARALQISRYDARIIENMGEAYYYLKKYTEALKYLEEYASLLPSGARIDVAYYYMGEIFLQLGEFQHADIAFTTALYHSPGIARWWARLGFARESAQDFRWALEAYEKALTLNASLDDALRGKARVQARIASG